jgi:hypothetical protein
MILSFVIASDDLAVHVGHHVETRIQAEELIRIVRRVAIKNVVLEVQSGVADHAVHLLGPVCGSSASQLLIRLPVRLVPALAHSDHIPALVVSGL